MLFSSKPYVLYFDMTKCVSYTTILTGCSTPQVNFNRKIRLDSH